MKVEISSNLKFFKLYPKKNETINWGNIETFRSLILAEIFLAREMIGGVHNASVTWGSKRK
jgi:hypothetical protein